jgi:ADP-heptose:LPS heptosyltransferase
MSLKEAIARNESNRAKGVARVYPEHVGKVSMPLAHPKRVPEKELTPCLYLTETPLSKGGCGSCVGKWVYPCDVYGKATLAGYVPGVKRCLGCVHYTSRHEPPKGEPVVTRLVLVNECCPGDVLVMSAAVESLHRTYPGEFITAYEGTAPELFDHNPNIVEAVPVIDGAAVEWQRVKMVYPLIDKCDERPVHFMQGYTEYLATVIGKPLPLVVNRPYVYLTPEESSWLPQVHEVTGAAVRYWLVNAGHKDDYPAKWWGTSNYQRVVDLLRGKVQFVQIGEEGHSHPPLSGVIDMRGKTDTRQFCRMVYHSAGGIGPSTFLQHLSAAFEKPYVCIAGGREPLAWQHYPRQATLSTIGVCGCEPSRKGLSCWRDRVQPSAEKPAASLCELPVISAGGEFVASCLESIRPERVAEEIWSRYNNGTRLS